MAPVVAVLCPSQLQRVLRIVVNLLSSEAEAKQRCLKQLLQDAVSSLDLNTAGVSHEPCLNRHLVKHSSLPRNPTAKGLTTCESKELFAFSLNGTPLPPSS